MASGHSDANSSGGGSDAAAQKAKKYNDLTFNHQTLETNRNSQQLMELVRYQQKNKAQIMSLDEFDDQESLYLDKHYENISNNFIGKQKARNGKMKKLDKKKQNHLFEESKQN